jgi:pyruvate formate lyase activating enzyme
LGGSGFCGIRRNLDGQLRALAYGHPVAIQVDPIEKKPLAEFLPGTRTFSLGTHGCNLGCRFCQNHHLSRGRYSAAELAAPETTPDEIVAAARHHGCRSVAFTYNEPLTWGEYVVDIARAARAAGLATVLVSNGYVTPEAAADIFPLIDAANIDIKGFSEDFYREMTDGQLAPVLAAAAAFHRGGGHLEITNLVIPGKNDSPAMVEALLSWIRDALSPEIPVHFSAYHPDHQYHASPPTPAATLHRIRQAARNAGLTRVQHFEL